MRLLDYVEIEVGENTPRIELYFGDLSAIPPEYAVDVLILSAFPDNYIAEPGSLIHSLHQQGLEVAELARDKEVDLRDYLDCWFSKELSTEQKQQFNFHRILCFEPPPKIKKPSEEVGDIFRCLNNFVYDDDINHVAMTLVATGKQKNPVEEMLPALLDAAVFWIRKGLPVTSIKIVENNFKKATKLQSLFAEYKKKKILSAAQVKNTTAMAPRSGSESQSISTNGHIDIFISYAHKNKELVQHFVTSLKQKKSDIRLFYDDSSIPKGSQWLKEIADSIDRCKKVLVFISPEYVASLPCWDEFQCAKVRQYKTNQQILLPIYLLNYAALPTIFEIHNWMDCREGDKEKLLLTCNDVIKAIEN